MAGRRWAWTAADRARLETLLDRVQSRRHARRLEPERVEALLAEAAEAPLGYAWTHGGEVGDARSVTTVALAVARPAGLTVGVGEARAQDVTPARAFRDVKEWHRHVAAANTTAALAWASRRSEDRFTVPWLIATATDDGEALLHRVVSAPDDEDARRVYADWLSERGHPRGELIQVQLDRARAAAGSATALELEAREAALLSEHAGSLVGPLPDGVIDVAFRGGFATELRVFTSEVLPALAPVAARETIRRVSVAGRVQPGDLAAAAWLSRVTALELNGGAGPGLSGEVVVRLLEVPYLRGLTTLVIRDHPLADVGAMVLAANVPAALPSLRELGLDGVGMTETGVQALASTRWLGTLDALSLSGNPLGAGGVEAVAFARSPGHLVALHLDAVRAGNEGATALARAPRLGSLDRLSLERNRIFQRGAQALLGSPWLAGLSHLSLRGNPIGDVLRRHVHERFG